MPCGGPKKSPRTSFIVQIFLFFWAFEISGGILRIQKIFNGLFSFSKQHLMLFWPVLDFTSFCNDYPIESCKTTVILFGSMLPNLKGH